MRRPKAIAGRRWERTVTAVVVIERVLGLLEIIEHFIEFRREVVRRHFHEALVVDWPAEALTDIDTPEDYERVRARIAP